MCTVRVFVLTRPVSPYFKYKRGRGTYRSIARVTKYRVLVRVAFFYLMQKVCCDKKREWRRLVAKMHTRARKRSVYSRLQLT